MRIDEQYVRTIRQFASKNIFLIQTEILTYWHSIPPYIQFSCQISPNSLFPSSGSKYSSFLPFLSDCFSICLPSQIPYLISVFRSYSFSLTQCICTVSAEFSSYLLISFFRHMTIMLISPAQLFSSGRSPSLCALITPCQKPEQVEPEALYRLVFIMSGCKFRGIADASIPSTHLTEHQCLRRQGKAQGLSSVSQFWKSKMPVYSKEIVHVQSVCGWDMQQARACSKRTSFSEMLTLTSKKPLQSLRGKQWLFHLFIYFRERLQ